MYVLQLNNNSIKKIKHAYLLYYFALCPVVFYIIS